MQVLSAVVDGKRRYFQVMVDAGNDFLAPFWHDDISHAKPLNPEQVEVMKEVVVPKHMDVSDVQFEDVADDFEQAPFEIVRGA